MIPVKLKQIGFSFLLLFLAGCKDLSGQITVYEILNLNTKKGVVSLPPDTYDTKVSVGKAKKSKELRAKIEISIGGKNNNPILEVPLKNGLPENQDIIIKAEESGQEFDILGRLRTDVARSQPRFERETCSVSVPKLKCSVNQEGQRICERVNVYVDGDRDVEFYHRTETTNLSIKLLKDLNRIVATSINTRTDIEKIYLFQGQCIPRYYPVSDI